MTAHNWLILAGIAGVLGVRPSLAGSIPLPNGQFAATMSGSMTICLTPDGSAEEPCNTAGGLVVPLRVLFTGVFTIDESGNNCASIVETDTGFPVNATTPEFTPNEHSAGTVTTYDSSTGTGDLSFTGYIGGSCNGASFDSTGARKISSGTNHFVVSEQGKRIDVRLTTLTNLNNTIRDFSLSGVNRAR